MDIAEFFKKGIRELQKQAIQKSYQQKQLKERLEDFKDSRRQTRTSLMIQKRKIDIRNLSPYNTPDNERILRKPVIQEEKKPSKRLEMLKQWKIEKQKRIQEDKQKSKPAFKVFHIPIDIGLPNLQVVNKEIKGKPIKVQDKLISKFAPRNHIFKPPGNIKPINFKNDSITKKATDNGKKENLLKTVRNVMVNSKPNALGKNVDKTSGVRRTNSSLSQELQKNKKPSTQPKNTKPIRDVKKNNTNPSVEVKKDVKLTKNVKSTVIVSNTGTKPEKTINKNIKVANNIVKKSPKDIIKKPPMKINTKSLKNIIKKSPKNIIKKSPKKVNTKSPNKLSKPLKLNQNAPVSKPGNFGNIKRQESLSRKPNEKGKPVMRNNKLTANVERQLSKTKINDKKKGKEPVQSTSLINKDETVDIECQREIFYNDDEITIKTPRKTPLKTPRKTPLKTPLKTPKKTPRLKRMSTIDDSITNSPVKLGTVSFVDDAKLFEKTSQESLDVPPSKTPRKSRRGTPDCFVKVEDADKDSKTESFVVHDNTFEAISHKTPIKTPRKNRRETPDCFVTVNDTTIDKITESFIANPVTVEAVSQKTPKKTPKSPRKSPTDTENNLVHTPTDKILKPIVAYISPFVTISRGKESARKEFKIRQSTGGTLRNSPNCEKSFLASSTSPKAGALYFSKKLDDEILRIERVCDKWEAIKNEQLPEDASDLIDTAVGQSRLLIAKKFQQFRDLIVQCRDCQYKEKPVTCVDLHGFWDMMYMQVEDLDKRFDNLDKLKASNWRFDYDNKEQRKPKARPVRQTKVKAASKIKDMIKQARARQKTTINDKIIDCILPAEPLEVSSVNKPTSQRLSVLQSESVQQRASLSPGLTMMKITQAIKKGDGVTPSSILKKSGVKSERRMTKCVLFKDVEDAKEKTSLMMKELNKENVNTDNIDPLTPCRRSKRLSNLL